MKGREAHLGYRSIGTSPDEEDGKGLDNSEDAMAQL